MQKKYDAVIIGAGVAGLVAALHLEEYDLEVLIIEKSNEVGGRVKTDVRNGYRFDRGFQVLLSSYPMVQKYLDLQALDLRTFEPGALSFNLKQKIKVSDVARNKAALLLMFFSSVGSFSDKWKLSKMRKRILAKSIEEIFDGPNISTLEYLKDTGFSDRIINRFFRPFYSGVFLENDLSTSARVFEFTFKMFAEGDAAVPAKGMGEIPLQLRNKLNKTEFRLNTQVKRVEPGKVLLEDGEAFDAKQVIIATDVSTLMPQVATELQWNSTSQFYFSAEKSIISKPLIGLQFRPDGLVNNIVELSSVSPYYAPKGKRLIQVSLRESPRESIEETSQRIKDELAITFGPEVEHWQYLQSYELKKALPVVGSPSGSKSFEETKITQGVYLAGDQFLNPSLNGAMQSGEMAAKALVLNHDNSDQKLIN